MKTLLSTLMLTPALAAAAWAGPGAPTATGPADLKLNEMASTSASATAPLMLTEAELDQVSAGVGSVGTGGGQLATGYRRIGEEIPTLTGGLNGGVVGSSLR